VKDESIQSQENKENSGIWVQLPQTETDLFSYDYIDREFSILNGKYVFKFKKLDKKIDEFEVWLR